MFASYEAQLTTMSLSLMKSVNADSSLASMWIAFSISVLESTKNVSCFSSFRNAFTIRPILPAPTTQIFASVYLPCLLTNCCGPSVMNSSPLILPI